MRSASFISECHNTVCPTENQRSDAKQKSALFLSLRARPESRKISWGNLGAIPPLGAVCAGGGGGACFGSNQLRRALSPMMIAEQSIDFHDLGALAVSRIQHCGNCSPCHIQPRGIICISGGRHCKALSLAPWLGPAQKGRWETGRCSICCDTTMSLMTLLFSVGQDWMVPCCRAISVL